MSLEAVVAETETRPLKTQRVDPKPRHRANRGRSTIDGPASSALEQGREEAHRRNQREDRDIAAASDELQTMREKRGSLFEERDLAQRQVTEPRGLAREIEAKVDDDARAVEVLRFRPARLKHAGHGAQSHRPQARSGARTPPRNLAQLTSRSTSSDAKSARSRWSETVSTSASGSARTSSARAEGDALQGVVDGERGEVEGERARIEEQHALRQRGWRSPRPATCQADEQKTHLNDAIVRRRELQIATLENLMLRTAGALPPSTSCDIVSGLPSRPNRCPHSDQAGGVRAD